jgi:hypothetical protein
MASAPVTDRGCRGNLRKAGEAAIAHRFHELTEAKLDRDFRLYELRPLVVKSVSNECLDAACRDIARGDGGELRWTLRDDKSWRPPSLFSVFSSCGAALNTFGRWRLDASGLKVGAHAHFNWMEFEVRLPIQHLKGRPPNLDVVLADETSLLAIESKLLETLDEGKAAAYQSSYADPMASLEVDPSWQELHRTGHSRFCYVGVGQLVRHYLGLKTQILPGGQFASRRATLLYLYWEPDDPDNQVTTRHRQEVGELVAWLRDDHISFEAICLRELWIRWATDEDAGTREHAALLESRYGVSLRP